MKHDYIIYKKIHDYRKYTLINKAGSKSVGIIKETMQLLMSALGGR